MRSQPLRAEVRPYEHVRSALACAAVLWAASLPLAASAASRPDSPWWSRLFALAIYEMGGIVCHQRPERSFLLGSVPLPVCARCTGMYLGAAMAALVTVVGARIGGRSDIERRTSRLVLAVAAAPALLTLVYEWASGHTPSNELRASSGVLVGFGVAWVLLRMK